MWLVDISKGMLDGSLPSCYSGRLYLLDEDTQVAFVIRSQSDDAESKALSFRLVQLKRKGEKENKNCLKKKERKEKERTEQRTTDLLIQLKGGWGREMH